MQRVPSMIALVLAFLLGAGDSVLAHFVEERLAADAEAFGRERSIAAVLSQTREDQSLLQVLAGSPHGLGERQMAQFISSVGSFC